MKNENFKNKLYILLLEVVVRNHIKIKINDGEEITMEKMIRGIINRQGVNDSDNNLLFHQQHITREEMSEDLYEHLEDNVERYRDWLIDKGRWFQVEEEIIEWSKTDVYNIYLYISWNQLISADDAQELEEEYKVL